MNRKPKKSGPEFAPRFWSGESYRNHHLASAKKFLELNESSDNEDKEKILDQWEERSNRSTTEQLMSRCLELQTSRCHASYKGLRQLTVSYESFTPKASKQKLVAEAIPSKVVVDNKIK